MKSYGGFCEPEDNPQVAVLKRDTCCWLATSEPSLACASQKLRKGQKVVQIIFNSGPTGRAFLCPEHARMLGEGLLRVTEGL